MINTNSIISSNDHGTKKMIDKMPPNSAQSNVGKSNTVTGMIRINKKGKGEFVAFSGNKLSIGRSSSCDLRLYSASCSSHHAEIELENDCCVLSDLNSTNGSSVNGEDVVRCILADGDKLSFGTERFVYLEQYMRPNGKSRVSETVTKTVPPSDIRVGKIPVVQLAPSSVNTIQPALSKKIKLMIMTGPRSGQTVDITYPDQGLSIGRPGYQLLGLTLENRGYVASQIVNSQNGQSQSEVILNGQALGLTPQVIENGDSLIVADIEFMVVFPGR